MDPSGSEAYTPAPQLATYWESEVRHVEEKQKRILLVSSQLASAFAGFLPRLRLSAAIDLSAETKS